MPQKPDQTRPLVEPAVSPTISFRLDGERAQVLSKRADGLKVSPHELARHYVMEMLQVHEERAALREAIQQIHETLRQNRADLAFAVRALLTSAGKVPEDKAEQWVKATIQPE